MSWSKATRDMEPKPREISLSEESENSEVEETKQVNISGENSIQDLLTGGKKQKSNGSNKVDPYGSKYSTKYDEKNSKGESFKRKRSIYPHLYEQKKDGDESDEIELSKRNNPKQ